MVEHTVRLGMDLVERTLYDVAEARVALPVYRRPYNAERPPSSVSYRTPAEFEREWFERRL